LLYVTIHPTGLTVRRHHPPSSTNS